jgi:nitric oxide reductase subunit B
MQQPLVELLVWLRVPGDTVFAIGAVAFAIFVLRLWLLPRRDEPAPAVEQVRQS